MSRVEHKSKSFLVYEERKPKRKKTVSPEKSHKVLQELRILTRGYNHDPLEDEDMIEELGYL